jgi:hypothetical protein
MPSPLLRENKHVTSVQVKPLICYTEQCEETLDETIVDSRIRYHAQKADKTTTILL